MTQYDIAVLILCIVWVILTSIELTVLSIKIYQEDKELRHIRKIRYELEKKVKELDKHE